MNTLAPAIAHRNPFIPDVVLPPGSMLSIMLEDIGMSQATFAKNAGISAKHVNEIIKGKMPLTEVSASAFEKVLGVPAEFWLRAEGEYRAHQQRKDEESKFLPKWDWIARTFPITELVRLGALPSSKDAYILIVALLKFFRVASPDQLEMRLEELSLAKYRKAAAHTSDPGALLSWIRLCEIQCQTLNIAPFNEQVFLQTLSSIRKLTRESPPRVFLPQLQQALARAGVGVVCVPELKGACISGVSKWLATDKAMIGLSARYKREDSLWFSFFHESAHLILHSKKVTFIDMNEIHERDDDEVEADRFAANTLIPPQKYKQFINTGLFDESAIRDFAGTIGISPGIVVGRLQHDNIIPYRSLLTKLIIRYRWTDS